MRQARERETRAQGRTSAVGPLPAGPEAGAANALRLQRAAGNRAVAQVLAVQRMVPYADVRDRIDGDVYYVDTEALWDLLSPQPPRRPAATTS